MGNERVNLGSIYVLVKEFYKIPWGVYVVMDLIGKQYNVNA